MIANAEYIPWYSEPGLALYQGDCRAILAQMPAESVDCVVFSPPFLGLRVYDGAQELIWGGKADCTHEWQESTFQRRSNDSNPGAKQATNVGALGRDEPIVHAICSLCGAVKCAWGLEPSVEAWVADTLEVMQAVKRVLKPSGVCWIEVGDSYVGSTGNNRGTMDWRTGGSPAPSETTVQRGTKIHGAGLKPKDLCLVPEHLALALQQDGWWVRSRIVWAKPNPMPESVTDRPTKSHSMIWMLTKAEDYYFDQEAVRIQSNAKPPWGNRITDKIGSSGGQGQHGASSVFNPQSWESRMEYVGSHNLRDVWTLPTQPFGYELCQSCGQIYTAAQYGRLAIIQKTRGMGEYPSGRGEDEQLAIRRCRCGSSDFLSHFATFPEALPTRCILASTSEAGCCPKCGKPWGRKMKSEWEHQGEIGRQAAIGAQDSPMYRGGHHNDGLPYRGTKKTLNWAPTCKCGLSQAENMPATVLDVCVGSGTTVVAAKRLGRGGIGIDLSMAYLKLARRRLEEVPLALGLKGG